MDSGGMPSDWKPTPPAIIGGMRWKREIIEKSIKDRFDGYKCKSYDCGQVGIFCVEYKGGWNYFWVDKENHRVLPDIDWTEMAKLSIANLTKKFPLTPPMQKARDYSDGLINIHRNKQ